MLRDIARVFLLLATCSGASVAQALLEAIVPAAGHNFTEVSAISSDGATVVGTSGNMGSIVNMMIKSGGGPLQLVSAPPGSPLLNVSDVSADGSVVVGNFENELGFRWTSAQGFQVLSPLTTVWQPNFPVVAIHPSTFVTCVSADGNAIIGNSGWGGLGPQWGGDPFTRAVIWSGAGASAQDLGALLSPFPSPWQAGFTYHGASQVGGAGWGYRGRVMGASGNSALLWTQAAPHPPNVFSGPIVGALWTSGSGLSSVTPSLGFGHHVQSGACSDDGSILLWTESGFARRDPTGAMTTFSAPTPQPCFTYLAVNRDATRAINVSDGQCDSWIWSTTGGGIWFDDFLATCSVDRSAWTRLTPCDLSADGRSIVGNGLFNGAQRGFVLCLPFVMEACDAMQWTSSSPSFALARDLAVPRRQGVSRKGVCADGVSQLVIRCTVDAPGVFRARFLASGNLPDQGQLGAHGVPFSSSTPVTVATVPVGTSGRHDVEILYKAPLDYARSPTSLEAATALRHVGIRIEYQEQGASTWRYLDADVQVRRPPVVAAHGLWSKPATWSNAFAAFETDPRFQWSKMDYEASNSRAFADNAPVVGRAVQQAVEAMRATGFACTQVDWVGHSMGGVLPRVYYAKGRERRGKPWERQDNYGAGDIHKLLALNSPQHGSPWANELLAWINDPVLGPVLAELMDAIDKPIDGAIVDLQEGSSAFAYLNRAGNTYIPSLAVVGIGGGPFITALGQAGQGLVALGAATAQPWGSVMVALAAVRLAAPAAQSGHGDIFEMFEHDLVVLEASQRAGLDPSFFRAGFNPPMTGLGSLHTEVTSDAAYKLRVVELLDTPVSSFASFLPPPELSTTDSMLTQSGGPPQQALPVGLTLNNSPPYQTTPGTIHLVVVGTGGFVPTAVQVLTPWGTTSASSSGTAPFSMAIPVPQGFAGSVRLMAFGLDGSGAVAFGLPLAVDLGLPGSLQSMSLEPEQQVLSAPLERGFLSVRGSYSGGVVPNIGTPAFGTTFASSNASVVAVSADGVLTALRPGVATITAQNGSATSAATVTVAFDPVTGYGDGVSGSGGIMPTIGADGQLPSLGNGSFAVRASNVLGGAFGGFLISWDAASQTLFDVPLLVDPVGAIFHTGFASGLSGTPGGGSLSVPTPIPSWPGLVGLRIYWQGVFMDPYAPSFVSATWGLVTTIVE